MENTIHYLGVDQFQELGRALKLQDCIYLDDNLDTGESFQLYDEMSREHAAGRFPYKLSFWAAIIDISGSMRTVINGREYRLDGGSALIVPSGAIVESLDCTPDIRDIAMAFADKEEILYSQKSTTEISSWLRRRADPYMFRINPDRLESYLALYREVKKLYLLADRQHKDDIVKGLLQISTALFASEVSAADSKSRPADRAEELYFAFLNDLQTYCSSHKEVSFYARKLCVCTKYFSRQIKAASGKTPAQLIKERVIIEAKALLNSGNDSIKRISEILNFPNSAYFCRYFRQETGMTPSEFRKS